MADLVPVQFKKNVRHQQSTSSVYPHQRIDHISYTNYQGQGEDSDRHTDNAFGINTQENHNRHIHSQQVQKYPSGFNHHPGRNDNLSMNFNSVSSKSSRGGLTSNYNQHDINMYSQHEIDSDILEGTHAFHQFSHHFSGNQNASDHNQEHFMQLTSSDRFTDSQPHLVHSHPFIKKQTNSLKESEVREIVKSFNDCLNKHSLEKIEIEKRTKIIIEKIDDKQQILINLFKDKENIMMGQEQTQILKETAVRNREQLSKYRESILVLGSDQTLINQQYEQSIMKNLLMKSEIKDRLSDEVFQKIKELEHKKQDLMEQNRQITEQIEVAFQEQKLKELKCLKCRSMFIPMHNEVGSCRYHPGQLKFFSCLGCGGNSYYTCCNKCMICTNGGCKQNKHVA